MIPKHRSLTALAALGALAVTIVGCSSSSTDAPGSPEPPATQQVPKELIPEYNDEGDLLVYPELLNPELIYWDTAEVLLDMQAVRLTFQPPSDDPCLRYAVDVVESSLEIELHLYQGSVAGFEKLGCDAQAPDTPQGVPRAPGASEDVTNTVLTAALNQPATNVAFATQTLYVPIPHPFNYRYITPEGQNPDLSSGPIKTNPGTPPTREDYSLPDQGQEPAPPQDTSPVVDA